MCLFFFKQKTAYEMRISDWSSDVCSSDLSNQPFPRPGLPLGPAPMTDGPTVTLAADFPAITLDDVRAAADRINGAVVRTPTLKSQTLSEMVGAEVWLKFENLQFTAAYKERGALKALLLLDDVAKADRKSTRLHSSH